MAYQYIAPKVPNRNSTAEEMTVFIEAHMENAQKLARRLSKHWERYKEVWETQGKPNMEATGYIQQAACEAGAPHFVGLHRCAAALEAEIHVLHTILGFSMDDNVNEVSKCWP